MIGAATAGAILIAEAVVGYAEGEIIGRVKNAALDKIGDRKLSEYILQETEKAAEGIQITECTRRAFDPHNKKFKTIRKAFANAVLRWGSGEVQRFITDPPCEGECMNNVATDLASLIRAVKARLWGDERFMELMRGDRFQEVLYKEFMDMKAEFDAFKERMAEMEIALKVLTDEVAELRDASGPPAPELVGRLMSTSSSFIGREEEIRRIGEAFHDRDTVFVTGFGGIGKTEVCREYAFRCMNSGQDVAWLTYSGSTRATISSGLDFRNLDDSSMDADERFTAKVRWIPRDALIVMDNYVQEDDMTDLLSLPCRVLVSARMMDGTDSIEIGPLPMNEAFGILKSKLEPGLRAWADANRDPLEDAIENVGRLTMMIPLMAGVINEKCPDPGSLAAGIFGWTGNVSLTKDGRTSRTDVRGHFRMLLDGSKLSDEEKNILRLMTMTPPGGIGSELLEELSGVDSDDMHRLIGLGLIRNEYSEEGISRSIHPLVGEFITADDPPSFDDGDLCRIYAENLSLRTEEIAISSRPADLGPYVGAIIHAAGVIRGCNDHTLAASCLYAFSRGLREYGMHRESLSIALDQLRIMDDYMHENRQEIGRLHNNIGCEYGELGDHEKALEYKLKALEIREKALPEGHPEIALSYNNVGFEYGELGDHEKALEYKLKALEMFEKVVPEKHPLIAISYDSIGSEYGYLGEREKALEYMLEALKIREKALPEGHPDIAYSYDNISSILSELGDHEKALEYKLKALEIREEALPEGHPDIAYSYDSIGYEYEKLGDSEKAQEYKRKASKIREKEHSDDESRYKYGFSTGNDGVSPYRETTLKSNEKVGRAPPFRAGN